MEGLWTRQTTAGLAPGIGPAQTGRLTAEVGYGFAAFARGMLTPYAGTSLADGQSRTYRLGTRWQGTTGLTLSLEGTQRAPVGQQAANQGFRLQAAWGVLTRGEGCGVSSHGQTVLPHPHSLFGNAPPYPSASLRSGQAGQAKGDLSL